MEPLSLIIAALAAGASQTLNETAGQAVRDLYNGLKTLVKRNLGDRPLAQDVIEKHSEAPAAWGKPLEEELGKAGIDRHEQVVRAAQQLLALVDPRGTEAGKYNVKIVGGKGIVVGDHTQVNMTFDNGD